MIQDFFIPFLLVGLAELGDKTQLAVFCLAAKTKKHFQLILGVILGFIITDGLAVVSGNIISIIIPEYIIRTFSGLIFLIFGIMILLKHKQEETKCGLKNPFLSGFGMIFVSEMGDKTQIASGLFAIQYNPLMVFFGVMLSLTILSVIAVYMGNIASRKINKKMISVISGMLFILIGIFSLITLLP
ncbi:TMEM165/GDT1 family protein [Candidatus Woesearchaeota archaeon]|nr:TMEM165/GDT1 family protein [Candidatus Woesearchaeota archaeon]